MTKLFKRRLIARTASDSVIHNLERRLCLSAVLASNVTGASAAGDAFIDSKGVLQIDGTNQPDVVDVSYNFEFSVGSSNQLEVDGTVTAKINGSTYTFDSAKVKQIAVNGYEGNDSIDIPGGEENNFGLPTPVNVVVNDGGGNDSINVDTEEDGFSNISQAIAPTSSVTVLNGDDNIFVGGSTGSSVTAGNGNDTISGSASYDDLQVTVKAGNGNDEIDGVSPGIANLEMYAQLGSGQDTLNNADDPDIGVFGYTSNGQSASATYSLDDPTNGNFDLTGIVTNAGKPLKGATVYLDINDDGKLDTGDISTTTVANGTYRLSYTPPENDNQTYRVSVIAPAGLTAYPLSYGVQPAVGVGYLNQNFALATPSVAHPVQFGTSGSYRGLGNVAANAVDGNLNTFFDGPDASGDFVALDYGSPVRVTQIKFAPRATLATRMVGGMFQASNTPDFSSAVTLYTITSTPVTGKLTTVAINNAGAYRYVRYIGPANGYCDIAEMQFGVVSKLTGKTIRHRRFLSQPWHHHRQCRRWQPDLLLRRSRRHRRLGRPRSRLGQDRDPGGLRPPIRLGQPHARRRNTSQQLRHLLNRRGHAADHQVHTRHGCVDNAVAEQHQGLSLLPIPGPGQQLLRYRRVGI
jgi:hypothetical protein